MSDNDAETSNLAKPIGAVIAAMMRLKIENGNKFTCDNCGAETDWENARFFENFQLCKECSEKLMSRESEWVECVKQEMREFLREEKG